jgi:hypothetical protein
MVIIGASLDELTDVTIIITAIISTGAMEGGLSWARPFSLPPPIPRHWTRGSFVKIASQRARPIAVGQIITKRAA